MAHKIAEKESTILHRRKDCWKGLVWIDTKSQESWCCHDALDELFDLESATRLAFVAKAKPDKTTYRVKLTPWNDLDKPQKRVLYPEFGEWLEQQIAAGRPNVGVRIIQ